MAFTEFQVQSPQNFRCSFLGKPISPLSDENDVCLGAYNSMDLLRRSRADNHAIFVT